MKALIVRLSSLGDVVCSLPAAAALKQGVPGAHITWVVDERFADIVRSCAAVDEVILRKNWSGGNYDVAFDLQGLLKSGLVLSKAKAKDKFGYHWQREGAQLFSRRVTPDPSSIHVVDQYVDVVRAAGCEADTADFALTPKPENLASVKTKIPKADKIVVLNPFSARESKRWPAEHYTALIDRLSRAGVHCVLIGSPADAPKANHILPGTEFTNLVGETSLGELIALISLAKAHVGGDTGSTHIAAALGIPAIGLYWATRPERSCPYGQIERCHFAEDRWQIKPEDVYNSVEVALEA